MMPWGRYGRVNSVFVGQHVCSFLVAGMFGYEDGNTHDLANRSVQTS